jgi:membrane-associated phospholipid phosphatase
MLGSVLVATAIKTVVKKLVSRARPRVLLDEGRYAFEPLGPKGGNWQSFPSGHTADAVAAARGLARVFPGTSIPGYSVAGLIGVVQIPRAKHYPLDVVAGAAVGIAAEFLVDLADRVALRKIGLPYRATSRGQLQPVLPSSDTGNPERVRTVRRSDAHPDSPAETPRR